MITLNCVRCGFRVAYEESRSDYCPRCSARAGSTVQLIAVSDMPARLSRQGSGRLRLHTQGDGGRHTVLLSGELDLASASYLEAVLLELCESGASEIAVDLGGVDFIDSSGMQALVQGRMACASRGASFSLTPGRRSVQRALDRAGIGPRLTAAHERPGVLDG